ncbi:unnamed protein product [Symbiodinium sp. CCMP2592]|nr:unnamed protein product [Symbiodinium sp. CCMP2592]
MENPHLKSILAEFPDVDAAALPWPAGAEEWEPKDLQLFIGSGGFLKPKKKKATEAKAASASVPAPAPAKAPAAAPSPAAQDPGGYPSRRDPESTSSFEVPAWSQERKTLSMPVRVHCEDTAPNGHVRIESLNAFAERIRSLALMQIMGVSLADLKEQNLAILATEYVIEIVGKGIRVLDTLRIDTTPEFPAAPLFPWDTQMFADDGSLYMRGLFGLNLCQISATGAYSGADAKAYDAFAKDLRKFTDPSKSKFSKTSLRFYSAYPKAGAPFTPEKYLKASYVVRSTDCDMYNVLFQGRVPSMMESCYPQRDARAFYVNIRMSVHPGDELAVHVFVEKAKAFFVCLRGKEPVLTAVGHYEASPVCQEEIKCLRAAFRAVQRQSPVLRSRFARVAGRYVQVVLPSSWSVAEFRESDLPDCQTGQNGALRLAAAAATLPPLQCKGPLLRLVFLRGKVAPKTRSAVVLTVHNALCDGWSMNALLQDCDEATRHDLHQLSFEEASQVITRMFLDPATLLGELWTSLGCLRPAWSRAILLGSIKAEMNRRCTPHRGKCKPEEIHLWPYCQWCHATSGVELCADCSVAAYCSQTCQEMDAPRHNLWCYPLLVSRLLWCALPHEALVWQELARRSPLTPYTAPSAAKAPQLPKCWPDFFEARFPSASALERLLLTESLSSTLTLLWLLDLLGLREVQRAIRVLLVGADNEADAPWEELLPHLSGTLELVLVGPFLADASWSQGGVSVCCRRAHLQDLSPEELKPLDVAVAFNSGMIYYKEWPRALPTLHGCLCPLAVTAWEFPEALQVQQLLLDANFEVPELRDNPFASHAPHRVTDDHGTTMFGNLVLFTTRPCSALPWQALVSPSESEPCEEDLRDALRLIQGHLEVLSGRRAELEMILDEPQVFREYIESDDFRIPEDISVDMDRAYRGLGF